MGFRVIRLAGFRISLLGSKQLSAPFLVPFRSCMVTTTWFAANIATTSVIATDECFGYGCYIFSLSVLDNRR